MKIIRARFIFVIWVISVTLAALITPQLGHASRSEFALDLDHAIQEIHRGIETECVDCAQRSAGNPISELETSLGETVCSVDQKTEPDPLGLDRLDEIVSLYGLDSDADFQRHLQKLKARLAELPSAYGEFSKCIGENQLTQEGATPRSGTDIACSLLGMTSNHLTQEVSALEWELQHVVCSKIQGEDAVQLSALLGLEIRSTVSRLVFENFAVYAPAIEKSSLAALVSGKTHSVQQLSDLVQRSLRQTILAKTAVDRYRLGFKLNRHQKRAITALYRKNDQAAACFQKNLTDAITALRNSGKSKAEIKFLVKTLKDFQREIKKAGGTRNNALKRKAINTLVVLSNLTWGLPNTAIGAVVGLASLVVHPFIPKEDRQPLDPKLSSNGKQLKMTSQLIYGPGRGFNASMGLIQTSNGPINVDDHEGGHAVQSAILGPFYLPVVGLNYLLSGMNSGPMESWADQAGAKTQPLKPETMFGCAK